MHGVSKYRISDFVVICRHANGCDILLESDPN